MATKSLNEGFKSNRILEIFKKFSNYSFFWHCAKDGSLISLNSSRSTNIDSTVYSKTELPCGINYLTDDDILQIVSSGDEAFKDFSKVIEYDGYLKTGWLSKIFPKSVILVAKHRDFSGRTPFLDLTEIVPCIIILKSSGSNKLFQALKAYHKKDNNERNDGAKNYQSQADMNNKDFAAKRAVSGEASDKEQAMYVTNARNYMQQRIEYLKGMSQKSIKDIETEIYKFCNGGLQGFSYEYLKSNKEAFTSALKINKSQGEQIYKVIIDDNTGVDERLFKYLENAFKNNEKGYKNFLIVFYDALRIAGTMYIPNKAQVLAGDYTHFRQAMEALAKKEASE